MIVKQFCQSSSMEHLDNLRAKVAWVNLLLLVTLTVEGLLDKKML